jgi:hypothetical protein
MPVSGQELKAAAAKRRKTITKTIEGIGEVRLRALSAGDAQRFKADVEKYTKEGRDPEELAFTLIARSWIDASGELLFPEAEGEQEAKALDPECYNEIAKEVLTLNGLTADAIEEAEKNSGASPEGSTPTGSPENSDTQT